MTIKVQLNQITGLLKIHTLQMYILFFDSVLKGDSFIYLFTYLFEKPIILTVLFHGCTKTPTIGYFEMTKNRSIAGAYCINCDDMLKF